MVARYAGAAAPTARQRDPTIGIVFEIFSVAVRVGPDANEDQIVTVNPGVRSSVRRGRHPRCDRLPPFTYLDRGLFRAR